MAYSLNDFYQLEFSNPTAPRVVVYPNNSVAANLLSHYKNKTNEFAVIALSDCISAGADRLPMPNDVIPNLKDRISENLKRIVLVGIDSYLSLLSESNVVAFWVAVQGILDEEALNATFMVCGDHYPTTRFSPHYSESKKVLQITGTFEVLTLPRIKVVSNKWVKTGDAIDYKSLLERLGSFLPTGEHTLVMNNLRTEHAGLSSAVSFLIDAKQVAERFYGLATDMGTPTLESLLTKANKNGLTPEKYLETEFDSVNIDARLALKRLLDLPDDELWSAYVWMLRKRMPANSYLSKVLSVEVTYRDLLRKYVVDLAVLLLDDNDAQKFADERAYAISAIGQLAEPLIIDFIDQTKEIDSAIRFLNCTTTAERVELIRRVSELDLTFGLPKPIANLFPALDDYLSTADYGFPVISEYFKEYRRLKINNNISQDFVNKAYSFAFPTEIPSRESLLSELQLDNTALLIVDGMGAEYFPLLVAMAKRRNMNIELMKIASAKMPTSTEFNVIDWDKERTLNAVRDVDNIAHYGAVKHENCLPEQNIEAALRVFETDVFNRVAEGLSKYTHVIVTADHGSSRLAVLAHNENFGTTLSWTGKPDDWRYSVAPTGESCTSEYEQQYYPETQKDYWAVRGYNRLPKPGGKPYELHGGASLEERLVPIVVFVQSASTQPPKQLGKKQVAEVVDEFEGLI